MTKLIQMKIMMTLSALLLLASTAGAQEQGGRWSLTPMAGMTWSTLSGDDATDCSSSLAWSCGVEVECRLGRLVSLDAGVAYTRSRIKRTSGGSMATTPLRYAWWWAASGWPRSTSACR